MFRNLLAHIPSERPPRPVIEGSVSLAHAWGAHLDAFSVGYVTATNVPVVAEGGAAVAAIFEVEGERARERAESQLGVLEVEAKNAGIPCSSRALVAMPADAASIAGAMARLYDLTIVLQPEFDRETFDNALPQEILFQAGGPVLFMPYTFRGAFTARRIGICWDGSRLAARALRDAMPLLRRADALTIIAVANGEAPPVECTSEHLLRHLARAGLPARIASFTADRSDIQPGLLSIAADESLDLLVMGGYGHSRLQEIVLGGVTREMLRSMTVPTLMSH
ncbi:universal stress protein [Bradyrhizobium sp. LMTR 3]|uniref:universal stress protein n=1 Tax=Bradyrhizobium sp. LMTR 3 TaxID=189873 RepID=UPI0008104F66|nr:universal stress protein [Bradyrhizobium sp. LMTR 3]OCK53602.1 universal stress protein UspA [Bradyrhizobium sp. LMTR 3]